MILFGYDKNNSNIYRCLDESTGKMVISRDVIFMNPSKNQHESEITFKPAKEQFIEPSGDDVSRESSNVNSENGDDNDSSEYTDGNDNTEIIDLRSSSSDSATSSDSPSSSDSSSSSSSDTVYRDLPDVRRSSRENKVVPPNCFGFDERFEFINSITEPKNITEANESKANFFSWMRAAKEEIDSLMKNETWQICELPKGRKAVGCKWLYKVKTNQNGEIERFKARLVAQGFSQKFGVDYDEVFAPVVKQCTFRTIDTIASKLKLKVYQFDLKTAFLNGVIKETIYMKQPPGFEVKGKEDHVCLLSRSLYGLKQAPKSWNDAINEILETFGFKRCSSDNCLYIKQYNDGNWCMLLIYVDDILITTTKEETVKEFQREISATFENRCLGEVKYYLGIEVNRENGIYNINQEKFINKIIKEFGLAEAKTSKIPLDSGYEKNKLNQQPLPSNEDYRK